MRSRPVLLSGCVLLVSCVCSAQSPTIQSNGVVNAAGAGHSAVVAPGSLMSIFGTGLAGGLATANSIPISTTLGDVGSVTIDGKPAPLIFVSEGQINAQVPWSVAPGQLNVVVTRGGVASQPVGVQVNQFAPALFGLNLGSLQAIATNADGSLTAPASLIPGITSHPAAAGDTITLFATGLGQVSPASADGANSTDATRQTTTPANVLMAGTQASVSFAGLSPQFVGVYQLNVVVPGGVSAGNGVPVQVQIGGVTSADPVTIALQ